MCVCVCVCVCVYVCIYQYLQINGIVLQAQPQGDRSTVRGAGVALRCRKQRLGAHARDFVVRQVHLYIYMYMYMYIHMYICMYVQPFVPRDTGLLQELCHGHGAPVAEEIFPKEDCAYCCDVGGA